MRKEKRIEFIIETLENLYPKVEVPLKHKDPYTLLIAVLLSAQCTDVRVNQVTPQLFALADNPFAMAKHSAEQILKIIKPCGLGPAKSRNIKTLSQMLVDLYGGQVPADMDLLEKLPGVGHKTASVVMNQAFGVPTFPVDTHIHRLAKRWKLSQGHSVVQTERDCKSLFPQEIWGKIHLQMIFYGREYCTARSCKQPSCLICKTIQRFSSPL